MVVLHWDVVCHVVVRARHARRLWNLPRVHARLPSGTCAITTLTTARASAATTTTLPPSRGDSPRAQGGDVEDPLRHIKADLQPS